MRRSRQLPWVFALVAVASCSDSATAPIEALTSAEIVGGGGDGSISFNTLRFDLGIHPPNTDPPPLGNNADLFGQLLLGAGDQNRTLVASSTTEDDFATFASFLTNGVDDRVSRFVGPGTGGGGEEISAESNFFTNRPTAGVDFAGYSIDRIEFKIDSISFTPNKNGGTDYYLRGKLVVFGRRN
jgi:hypothetical protein